MAARQTLRLPQTATQWTVLIPNHHRVTFLGGVRTESGDDRATPICNPEPSKGRARWPGLLSGLLRCGDVDGCCMSAIQDASTVVRYEVRGNALMREGGCISLVDCEWTPE